MVTQADLVAKSGKFDHKFISSLYFILKIRALAVNLTLMTCHHISEDRQTVAYFNILAE